MGANQRIAQLEKEIKFLNKLIEQLAPYEQIVRTLKEIVPEESYAMYSKFGNRVHVDLEQSIRAVLEKAA